MKRGAVEQVDLRGRVEREELVERRDRLPVLLVLDLERGARAQRVDSRAALGVARDPLLLPRLSVSSRSLSAKTSAPAIPAPASTSASATSAAARRPFRLAQSHVRSTRPTGRATIGLPSRKRPSSSPTSLAER